MSDNWREVAKKKIASMPDSAKEIREAAFNDLYFFARLVNPGYMYGEIHLEVFKWLQDYQLFGKDGDWGTNKLIMLPRAHLKSHMVATWAAWIITRHPEITILYVSATAELAEKQLYAIKNIMESGVYQRYFPEYIHPQEGKRSKWSVTKINVDHEKRIAEGIRDETVATAGLTTNTTGWHADVILADDLVVPENAYTEDGRASVSKKSSQFTSIRNAGGFTLACGTRYHPKDVYASWKDQYYPIFNEEGEHLEDKPVWDIKEYAVEEDGVFIWPRSIRPSDGKAFGFDLSVLSRIKAEYEDRTQFFSQYYNDPNEEGSNRISRDKFQYYDKKHLRMSGGTWYFKDRKLNVYASIDFAFSYSKRSDDTAIVVIGIDEDNQIYVLDIDVFKSDKISEYFKRVIDLHIRWEFRKLRAEVTVAQAVIVRDLKMKVKESGHSLVIEEYRPTRKEGSKEERIAAALEHRYDNMEVWHYQGGYTEMLEEQLVLAKPPKDDIKDALASAVEIAIKPGRSSRRGAENVPKRHIFNSRFGGVAFRG